MCYWRFYRGACAPALLLLKCFVYVVFHRFALFIDNVVDFFMQFRFFENVFFAAAACPHFVIC